LSPETSDLVGKLLKPDSLSTPEKRDEIADDIEDIYDDLMEGWENSPPEAKMALGGLLAVASFVAMHSAMKPLAKVAEGAMQVEKSSKKLNQVNSVINKNLRESLDTDTFTNFYKKLSASAGSPKTQKEFNNRQNKALFLFIKY
jgi:flagellin-specific chaperone FliS